MEDRIEDAFCSLYTDQAGAPLAATATHGDVWLLLEYNGPWQKKAFEASDLPETVKARLSTYLETLPDARLQLIKSRSGLLASGISFFVVHACEEQPKMWEFQLDAYEDILAIDLPQILTSQTNGTSYRRSEPLFEVCTNGRRDLCCAKFGLPVAVEMAKIAGSSAWQSTHIGGHRYAPNMLVFPYGLNYGRVQPEEARVIYEATLRGEIYLKRYRGRTCYSPFIQAAEAYLRQESRLTGIDAIKLAQVDHPRDDEAIVVFAETGIERRHALHIRREVTETLLPSGCLTDKKEAMVLFHLEEHEVLA